MKIIFRVSKLSKKILLKDFGPNIKLSKHNIEHTLINTYDPSFKKQNHITELLQIEVPRDPRGMKNAGDNLHKFHLKLFENFVYSQVLSGLEAMAGIRIFYNLYNIDEDDFSMESAYRRWQRFFSSKKMRKTCENGNSIVLRNCNIFTLQELEIMIGKFISDNFKKYVGSRGKIKKKRINQTRFYFYNVIGKIPISEIVTLTKFSDRTLYWNITQFKSNFAKQIHAIKLYSPTHMT